MHRCDKRIGVVCVAMPMGRCGSSAMMGLLALSETIYLGERRAMAQSSAINPKGFFELNEHHNVLSKIFPGFYPEFGLPPELPWVLDQSRAHAYAYRGFMEMAFNLQENDDADRFIALKAPRALALPLLLEQKHFRVKAIYLTREKNAQAKSIKRVWDHIGIRSEIGIDEILLHLDAWYAFCEEMFTFYGIDICRIDHRELMCEPLQTASKIADFIGIPPIDEHLIRDWIDPSLVERKRLD